MINNYPVIREGNNSNGFGTVHLYEQACIKAGRQIRRIPCVSSSGAPFVVLQAVSTGKYDSIDIINPEEDRFVLAAAVLHDGSDFEKVLNKHGYFLPSSQPATEAAAPAPAAAEETDAFSDLVQLSLFA